MLARCREMESEQTKRIVDHFRRSIDSYEDDARVQRTVGEDLVARLAACPNLRLGRVLEVGCCTGSMTEALCSRYRVDELWLNDIVPECCDRAANRVGGATGLVHVLPGDIEQTRVPDRLDMIISSSTFQWLGDLAGAFATFSAALNTGGYLAFTMFGPGTMQQVRELIGVGLDYPDVEELLTMLQPEFEVVDHSVSRHSRHFATPKEVLRHIQATGVGGAGCYRWTPGRLRQFDTSYRHQFGTAEGVPLDYVSICVIARKRGAANG